MECDLFALVRFFLGDEPDRVRERSNNVSLFDWECEECSISPWNLKENVMFVGGN